ncbi:hypothetical protein [Streptosporangium saharense]|uniref:hypothetical protein n=1 Tax=Streptosporangium saharense TaxID=1706840 RepID=UPI003413DCCA
MNLDPTTLQALSNLVRSGQAVPVQVADVTLPKITAPEKWGVASATATGYVVRPVAYPNPADLRAAGVHKGDRVPVPYLTPDGEIATAMLWPLVGHDPVAGWWWAHNGWSVAHPGDIHETAAPNPVSPDLPYEVRVWHAMEGLLGADYVGSASAWETAAWCATSDAATELADAFVTHRTQAPKWLAAGQDAGYLRAEVYQQVGDNGGARRIHRADADPARPTYSPRPYGEWSPGRPTCLEIGPEPTWSSTDPPRYELKAWSASDGWRSVGWFYGRQDAGIAATKLRIGAGGPYAYGETIGPDYPRAWAHDWTQHGRCMVSRHPDVPYEEEVALRAAGQDV